MSTALEHAVKLLSYRNCSCSALLDKLVAKGYTREQSEQAVERLKELKLLDDLSYAGMLMRDLSARGYGAMRIRRELSVKGVGRDDAAAVMENYQPDFEWMQRFISSKSGGRPLDRETYAKISRSLAGRGFMWDEISDALNKYSAGNDQWE